MIENICNGLEPTCATIELVCRDGWPFSWLARQSLTQCREAALVDDWKRFSELQNLRISVQTKWVTHQSDDGTNQSSESPRLSEIRLCRKCQRLALVCADSVYNPLVGQADTAFRVQWRLQACLHSLTNHCFACVPLLWGLCGEPCRFCRRRRRFGGRSARTLLACSAGNRFAIFDSYVDESSRTAPPNPRGGHVFTVLVWYSLWQEGMR